jgi:RNA polymerase sigma-B factor
MGLVAANHCGELPSVRDDAHGRARERLIEEHMYLVLGLARRYAHRGERLDDLVQVGAIGLIKAVDRFKPDRGVELRDYAVPTIVGEIKRHLRDRGSTIRIPRRDQEMRTRLLWARRELSARLDRPPTWAELASATALAPADLVHALEAERAALPLSLSDGAQEPAIEDDGYLAGENRALVDEGFEVLDQREQRALRLSYFEGLSQREVARLLGISQSHVSRIIAGALAKMRAAILGEPRRIVQRNARA